MNTLIRNERFPMWSKFFPEFFGTNWSNVANEIDDFTVPSVNIRENTEAYGIEVAAPGLQKENFKIELENTLLTISAEKNSDEQKTQNDYVRKEFNYLQFKRSFTLPVSVNKDNISAKYDNGILYVYVPKKEESKLNPVRQIAIG